MKTLLYLVFASVLTLASCTTNRGVSAAFSKYAHEEGVTSVTLPGWLMRMGASFSDLESEEKALLKSINKVKVLVIENNKLNARVDFHDEFFHKINKKGKFEELIRIHDKGEDINILARTDQEVIREVIILVSGDDNVIVYLKGKVDPELIRNLAMKNI